MEVGTKILERMNGLSVDGQFKWNKKECAIQMPSKPCIRATADGKKETRFDTELALQRLMINKESALEAFNYEMANYPPALFNADDETEWEEQVLKLPL